MSSSLYQELTAWRPGRQAMPANHLQSVASGCWAVDSRGKTSKLNTQSDCMHPSSPTPPPTPGARLDMAGVLTGIRRMAPLSLFVVVFGLAFGVAALARGLS